MKSPTLENRGSFQKTILRIGKGKNIWALGPLLIPLMDKIGVGMCGTIPSTLRPWPIDQLPLEVENLTKTDRYNEYVMTGLRTIWGVSMEKIKTEFGNTYLEYLNQQSKKYLEAQLLFEEDGKLLATKKGKFLVDGIASDLFFLD